MRILRVGVHAVLLELADGDEVDAWRAELLRRRAVGELRAIEIVPGARTILLDGVTDVATTATLVGGWGPPPAAGPATGDLIRIPVEYDGEDLADVAAAWGTDEAGVIERLSATELRVAFCGFSPGWGYLTGLPPELAMPRLDTPRQRVPAGSVALGGEYVGIYPTASPGGWRLIGRTDVTLFDVTADPPALLTPGKRVRLVAVAATRDEPVPLEAAR
ncbi:allophanate hydrolase subunit 1 [Luedemannella flava]|uniref:Allophanate hydrolase subunit 1 n=1 Tax=Luedemannella flava TaxID=349316 RepID=A0ABN2LS46_9ACTN